MQIQQNLSLKSYNTFGIDVQAAFFSNFTSLEELSELIHPHPSIIEGIQECVRMLKGKSVLKPYIFKDTLRFRSCDCNGNYSDIVL